VGQGPPRARRADGTSTLGVTKTNAVGPMKGDPHDLILRPTVHPRRPRLRLRRAEMVIPCFGHFVAEEAPEEMLAALTAFLAPYRDGSAAAHGARPHVAA
jgi:hypothetical protein